MPGTPSSAASSRLERQHRDLRRAVDPDRHVDRPDAAADEHRRLSAPADARRRPGTSARRRRRRTGSTTWPPCVCPESTSGIVERRGFGQPARIVREQDVIGAARRARARAMSAGRLVQKRMPTRSSALVPDRQARPRVLQHLDAAAAPAPPACRDRRRDCRGCAKTPCGADSGASASADGRDEAPIAPGHVVAAEHDQVGVLAHQHADGASDIVVRHQRLRWTSVIRPMRRPASAGGRPATGTVVARDRRARGGRTGSRTRRCRRARRRPWRAAS